MTYEQTVSETNRLRSLLRGNGDDSVFREQDRALISRLYLEEIGEPLRECSCKHRYSDAVIEIYHSLKTRGKMAKEMKYQLKAGVLAWIGNDCYNRHTLTDELAEKYLKMHPDARDQFDRVPKAAKTTGKTDKQD